MRKEKVVVLSGAGISAESGIDTFRDAGGLWEGHDVMEVATPEGFKKNPALVLDFYNKRRQQLLTVAPNSAQSALVELEKRFEVAIITQNVDDLHERAGSSNVLHLHGELLKARSVKNSTTILTQTTDIKVGDKAADGGQLRPHIVWFGEEVPLLENAAALVAQANYIIIVGTSMQVYPAAGLIDYASQECTIYVVDPKPQLTSRDNVKVYAENATTGIKKIVASLLAT